MWLKLLMFMRQTEPKFGLRKDMKVKTFKHILPYWLIPVGTWCRSWWFFHKKFWLLKIRNLKWFWMFLKIGSWWNFAKKERNTLQLGRLSRRKFFGDSGSHSQHRSKCSTVISLLFSLVRSCHWLFYRSHSIVL
jgi:hypothetical protein